MIKFIAYVCAGCDWIQFKYPDGREVGSRYSGSDFPGTGSAPLEIEGDTAFLTWHTDGSGVAWGWKFTATGIMPPAKAKVCRSVRLTMLSLIIFPIDLCCVVFVLPCCRRQFLPQARMIERMTSSQRASLQR